MTGSSAPSDATPSGSAGSAAATDNKARRQNARAKGQTCPRPPGRIFACFGDFEPGEDSRCQCGRPPCGCFAGQRSGWLGTSEGPAAARPTGLGSSPGPRTGRAHGGARRRTTCGEGSPCGCDQAACTGGRNSAHVTQFGGSAGQSEQAERELARDASTGAAWIAKLRTGLLPRPICLRATPTSPILVSLWCPKGEKDWSESVDPAELEAVKKRLADATDCDACIWELLSKRSGVS